MTAPDLRTLAAEAIRQLRAPHGPLGDGSLRSGSAGEIADAVLAAVLPEHRRMVLREAAEAIEAEESPRPPGAHRAVWVNAKISHTALLRRLAATAPPAGLSATVAAENAPAVPEEADGQRVAEGDALTYAEMEAERDRLARELTVAEEHSADVIGRLVADRDRLAAQVAHYQRVVEAVRALHQPTAGEADTQWCSVCSQDEEQPQPTGWWVPWPCPTIAAVDALPDAGTDQTEDATDVHL